MYTLPPFFRYSPAISARRCQRTTLCHSVRSCQLPSLPLKRSLVASVIFATGVPCGVYFTSGSLPRFPIRMTLLTLFINAGSSKRVTIAESGGAGRVSDARGNCDEFRDQKPFNHGVH